MRARYWVQYTLLITACTGGAMAVQYHKGTIKKNRPCCEQRSSCPKQTSPAQQVKDAPLREDTPSSDHLFSGSANRFIVYAR
jgi:hypothetical protein